MIFDDSEVTIRLTDNLPVEVLGTIAEDIDGHVNIYLNAKLSRDGTRRSFRHEWDHYLKDDLRSGEDIRVIEARDRRPLPRLFKASELLPKPVEPPSPPVEKAAPEPESAHKPLTPRQIRAIQAALDEFDRMYFGRGPMLENGMVIGDF